MQDKQKLTDYANNLEEKFGEEDEVVLTRPQISHIRFGTNNAGMPNLRDAYTTHSHRERQSRDRDGNLTQLRDC